MGPRLRGAERSLVSNAATGYEETRRMAVSAEVTAQSVGLVASAAALAVPSPRTPVRATVIHTQPTSVRPPSAGGRALTRLMQGLR